MGRGFQGALLKAFRAREGQLRVLETENVTPSYRRLRVDVGDLFDVQPPFPTMWLRGWFPICEATETSGHPGPLPDYGSVDDYHQRAYTLVDCDRDTKTASIEFSLHEGKAANWGRLARAGDVLDVSVMGARDPRPETPPTRWILVADPASLAATNGLLAERGEVPATVYFQHQRREDHDLHINVTTNSQIADEVIRLNSANELCAAVEKDAERFAASGVYAYVAVETAVTRKVVSILKSEWGLEKQHIVRQGYWKQ